MRPLNAGLAVCVLLVLIASATNGQHVFLAGGGLTEKSEFFWEQLVRFAVRHTFSNKSITRRASRLVKGGKGYAKIGVITAGRDDPEDAAEKLKVTRVRARDVSSTSGSSDRRS